MPAHVTHANISEPNPANEGGEKYNVEKSKETLSELRKRIEERKRSSKGIGAQYHRQYQEGSEEIIPELAQTEDDEDSDDVLNEESPYKEEALAHQAMKMTKQKKDQAAPTRGNLPANK